jgi:hypothetical protein
MAIRQSPPDPWSIGTYVEEGASIAAILFVWAVLAAVAVLLLGNVGGPGSLFAVVGTWLGYVLGLAGFLNAVLYVVFRAIDYWQAG